MFQGSGGDTDRQFIGILAAILTDGLEAVETACHEALGSGPHTGTGSQYPCRAHNVTPALCVVVPAALALFIEPAIRCGCYDQFARGAEGHAMDRHALMAMIAAAAAWFTPTNLVDGISCHLSYRLKSNSPFCNIVLCLLGTLFRSVHYICALVDLMRQF